MNAQINTIVAKSGFEPTVVEFTKIHRYLRDTWNAGADSDLFDMSSLKFIGTELLHLFPDAPGVSNVYQVIQFFKVDVLDMGEWTWELGEDANNEMWMLLSGDRIVFSDSDEGCLEVLVEDTDIKGELIEVIGDEIRSIKGIGWDHKDQPYVIEN